MKSLSRPDFENGRLLLVDCDERTLASLHKSLRRLGITAEAVAADTLPALDGCFAAIVELEHFASPATLARLEAAGVPLIALTAHETLSQIQRAIELGVTALLNKPITQGSVYTTLMMAIGLRARLAEANRQQAALARRVAAGPLLARPLARLMVERTLTEQQAYEQLRELSMRLNRSVEALCAEFEVDRLGADPRQERQR
ncbi:response regulator [Pseudomonas aeruginosa]|nr:response regulator [Pseudomonas aeruginosa]